MTLFFLVLAFSFLILFPGASFDGAKNGLMLWFEVVLPTLFPFLVITNLMEKLIPIASGRAYTIFTGFISGYPIGAKSCNYVVANQKISKKEGQFLLSLCNNASPAFLLNYCFVRCLGVPGKRFLLLLTIYLSAALSSLLILPKKKDWLKKTCLSPEKNSSPASFDGVLMKSFEIITKIGGYIILFSLLANIINVHMRLPELFKILICGFLEITTGMNLLFESALSGGAVLLSGMFIAAFGGLSALFQTGSVIRDSNLSLKTYFLTKTAAGIISLLLTKGLLLLNIL